MNETQGKSELCGRITVTRDDIAGWRMQGLDPRVEIAVRFRNLELSFLSVAEDDGFIEARPKEHVQ